MTAGVKNSEAESVCCLLTEDSLAFVPSQTCPGGNKEQREALAASKAAAQAVRPVTKASPCCRKVHSGETQD